MLLVVPYHAAHLYESQKDWWVHSNENSILFDLIISLQKSFCMSAFFLVSGFLSALVIDRKGLRAWSKTRVPRLVVPFIACMFTVQILQMIIVAKHEGAISTYQFWWDYLRERDRINIFHLWFIPCLLILCSAFGLIVALAGKRFFIWNKSYAISIIYILIIAAAVFLVGRLIPPLLPFKLTLMWQILDFREALYYIVPFLVGAKLFWDRQFQAGFLRFSKWTAMGGVFAYIIVTVTLHADNFVEKAMRDLALPLAAICISQSLIAICYKCLNKSNKISEKLSDASYSIYLFHQPIVLFIGIKFLDIDLNIFVEYLIVVAAALVIPFLIHFCLVKRIAALSFLFNGTPLSLRSRSSLPAG